MFKIYSLIGLGIIPLAVVFASPVHTSATLFLVQALLIIPITYVIALRAYQRGLVMHQLKYLDEIRPMDEIGDLGNLQQVDSKELSLGKTLVENLTTEKFDLGQYSDSYAKELEKLIQAKSKGQKITAKQEEEPKETTDILEALKASLKVKGKPSTTTLARAKGKMGMAEISK
jgi:non-homologous end joining protein Ku